MAYGACAIDGRSSKGGRARVTILRGTEGVKYCGPVVAPGTRDGRVEAGVPGPVGKLGRRVEAALRAAEELGIMDC